MATMVFNQMAKEFTELVLLAKGVQTAHHIIVEGSYCM